MDLEISLINGHNLIIGNADLDSVIRVWKDKTITNIVGKNNQVLVIDTDKIVYIREYKPTLSPKTILDRVLGK